MQIPDYRDLVDSLADGFDHAFGSNLVCVVQIGSLGHGGFSALYSDIDIAFILEKAVNDAEVEALVERLKRSCREGAERLSIFYTNPDFSWGRLRPIDQVDLIDSGRAVRGQIPKLSRPSRACVQEDLREHSLPYWQEKSADFASGVEVGHDNIKEYLRCLIYPARLVYTWLTGGLASNDSASTYLSEHAPEGIALEPVVAAIACRNDQLAWQELLKYQSILEQQRAATLRYLGISLNPAADGSPIEQG